jgi:phospholipid transport system substrate-binding protein
MMRLLSRAALIVFAAGMIASGAAQAATDPAATINDFYATLLQTMKQGPQLGETGRYNALAPAVRQDFDLGGMTQMAVGPSWAKLTPAERTQVTDAFTRYTIATYAGKFAKDDGEKLEVKGAKAMPYGTVVDTQLVQSNGDAVSINYLMRQNGKEWKVADIYLTGTISQIANLRSQFSAVILRGGAQELVATLNQKTASLVPNLAAS